MKRAQNDAPVFYFFQLVHHEPITQRLSKERLAYPYKALSLTIKLLVTISLKNIQKSVIIKA